MVLVVGGADRAAVRTEIDEERLLDLLAGVLAPRVASEVAARLTGGRKNDYYARMLQRTRIITDSE
jgi:ribosomal protein L13